MAANPAIRRYALRFPFRAVFSAVRRKIRGATAYRPFAALVKLHGLPAAKHVEALTDAFEEFMHTGAETAAASFWRSFIRLSKMADKLPPELSHQASLDLVWRMQGVLAKETNAARVVRANKIVKKSSALNGASKALAKGVAGTGKYAALLPNPAALVALGKIKDRIRRSNRALWAVWKRFDTVVGPNHIAVVQALRRITEDVDAIRALLKKRAFAALDSKHLWNVRGLLGEAYALMSKAWRKEAEKLLREAEELALKRGPGWTAQYLTQLEHAIEIGGREGPDGVVVLFNHNTGEAVLHAVAQVKIEKTLSAFQQLYRDLRRLLGQEGIAGAQTFGTLSFRLPNGAMSPDYLLVGGASLPKLHVLSAADSVMTKSDLDFLKQAGASVAEFKLDLTVNQLTRLAISTIEGIVKYF